MKLMEAAKSSVTVNGFGNVCKRKVQKGNTGEEKMTGGRLHRLSGTLGGLQEYYMIRIIQVEDRCA